MRYAPRAADRSRRRRDALPLQPGFKSVYAIVPAIIMLLLILIPAMLTASAWCARRRSARSPTSTHAGDTASSSCSASSCPTSSSRLVNFATPVSRWRCSLFGVPLKGSLPALCRRRPALRHRRHRLRPADLDLRHDADRRRSSPRRSSPSCRRCSSPGFIVPRLVAAAARGAHRLGFPSALLPADQHRHLHQGARLRRPAARTIWRCSRFAASTCCSAWPCSRRRKREAMRGASPPSTGSASRS